MKSFSPLTPRIQATAAAIPSRLLPPFLPTIVIGIFLLVGIGENTGLALISLLALLIGSAVLWRTGEPPVLLFIFANQWIQASLSVFYENWLGQDVGQISQVGGNTELAVLLSLVGLLALAAGMRLGAGRPYVAEVQLARQTIRNTSQIKLFWLYALSMVIAALFQIFARYVPGLYQPLLAVANIKWAAYFILTFATFARRDSNKLLWLLAFVFELAESLGGYFSSFKFVFLFTLIALVTAQARWTVRAVVNAVVFGSLLVAFGLVWTAVKVDYRAFLNGGAASQAVVVDYDASVEKLFELVSSLNGEQMENAVDQLIRRIEYTDYFGVVLNTVPTVIPHADGALWLDAIERPFMPRLLFPDKAAIDDSALTNKYTGLGVAGVQQGTTISIGYIGESYIDFGSFGMVVPIFGLGFLLGWIYRRLMTHPNSQGYVGMGLSAATLIMESSDIGNSTSSMFGAILITWLVAWLLVTYAIPILLPRPR